MMELRGDIPGLLRRGSPVTADWLMPAFWAGTGVVVRVYDNADLMLVGCCSDGDMGAGAVLGGRLALDLSDPTGRFHARLWLAERGHDVGSEDRAEVLAWSVLSVWRGGKPLAGVAQKWSFVAKTSEWRRRAARPGFWTASVRRTGWQSMGGMGDKTGEAGKAAADADLLALGWALTNADGTLTLPPLPGAK